MSFENHCRAIKRDMMSKGLYSIDEFKDNCGFGLTAHSKGQVSHGLLEKAIESLTCMTHRGGIAADGKTGDGCGLLLQKPDRFFRSQIRTEFGIELAEQYGVSADPGIRLRIQLSHQDLANVIGSTRETVTVVLGELQSEQKIKLGRRQITILDLEQLAQSVQTAVPELPATVPGRG